MLCTLRVLGVFGLGIIVASPALAQGALSPDEKELAAYTLTMPTLKKVMAAMRAMAEEAKKDPRYQQVAKLDEQIESAEAELETLQSKEEELTKAEEARIEQLEEQLEKLGAEKDEAEGEHDGEDEDDVEDQDDDDGPIGTQKTIDEMEQSVRDLPPLARALEREGLSPREYSKFMLAMMQAGMIYGFSQGKVDYAKLPPGVNAANVKFIGEHQAEFEAMQKEFESLEKTDR